MSDITSAKEIAFTEALRMVPEDACLDWQESELSSHHFPVGNYCHVSADTIDALCRDKAELVEALAEWDEPGACGCDTATCRDTCLPARTRAILARITAEGQGQ